MDAISLVFGLSGFVIAFVALWRAEQTRGMLIDDKEERRRDVKVPGDLPAHARSHGPSGHAFHGHDHVIKHPTSLL